MGCVRPRFNSGYPERKAQEVKLDKLVSYGKMGVNSVDSDFLFVSVINDLFYIS